MPTRSQLDIEPDGPCWLAATADGRQVVYRLLAAGERTSIEARDAVVLRVGDAGRFRFAVNGQTGRTLGDAGQALTVTITRQNYREFLATPVSVYAENGSRRIPPDFGIEPMKAFFFDSRHGRSASGGRTSRAATDRRNFRRLHGQLR